MNLTLLYLIIFFCLAIWLGLFLIRRDWREGYLRMAGLGLVSYAIALAFRALIWVAPVEVPVISLFYQFFIFQPALLWAGGLLHLLPDESKVRRLLPFYNYGEILVTEILIIFNLIGAFPSWGLVLLVGLPIFIYLIILIYEQRKYHQTGRLALAIVGTIFFGLSIGLFIPEGFVPEHWLVFAMGFDLIVLGIGIGIHDAYQEGHDLLRSMWHNLQSTFFICLLIGGQVVLVILGLGIHMALIALLLGLLATSITIAIFTPQLRLTKRAEALENSEHNLDPDLDLMAISETDFVRFTRRAISYLDDLPKLASSPLTQLPFIETRLSQKNLERNTLERTNELKTLLIEGIHKLKPDQESSFGTTDAWRFYNAVYFPYVAGIKPSRRYQSKENLADYEIEALEWFRREVPERTLYNWQNKAAELIALGLREKIQSGSS